MSGSPILNADGAAIGLISTGNEGLGMKTHSLSDEMIGNRIALCSIRLAYFIFVSYWSKGH
jgi:hypothetical protein